MHVIFLFCPTVKMRHRGFAVPIVILIQKTNFIYKMLKAYHHKSFIHFPRCALNESK